MFSIDDITDRMKDLLIGNNGKEIVEEEHNAIVPYRGHDAVVPFEVFDPIKKRRPRPKVDLDPETNRLWNLLMGKEGIESAQPMDNDKQKWWEEERKVFRGRVDSFIARMHLVQGIYFNSTTDILVADTDINWFPDPTNYYDFFHIMSGHKKSFY